LTQIEETKIEKETNLYAQESLIPSNYWNDLLENYELLNDKLIC